MIENLNYKTAKRGFKILLALIAGTVLSILLLTRSKSFLVPLLTVRLEYIVLAFLMFFFSVLFLSLYLKFISKIFGAGVSIKYGMEIFLSGFFIAGFTPFGSGGLPYQIYLLTRKGLKIHESILIFTLFGITKYIFVFIYFLILLPFISIPFFSERILGLIKFWVFLISGLFLMGCVLILLLKEEKLLKLNPNPRGNWWSKILNFIVEQIVGFKRNIKILALQKNWRALLFAIFSLLISLTAYLSLTPIILLSLNHHKDLITSFGYQVLTMLLLLYNPFPGGIFAQEGIGYILFSQILSSKLVGSFILLWRFFNFYISSIIGGFLVIGRLGREN